MKPNRMLVLVCVLCGLAASQGMCAGEAQLEIEALKHQIQALDEKVRLLEQQQAAGKEQGSGSPKEKPKAGPSLSVGEKGFALRSAEGDFELRLRGLVQGDSRFFFDERNNDGFLVRRARIEFSGAVFKNFYFRIMPEFSGSPTILDAWLDWRLCPAFQVLAGKVKLPVGLERFQPVETTLMTEFGYPTALVPNRDIGVALHGAVFENALDYYAGVFNGTSDGDSSTTNPDDDESFAARLFARPFDRCESGLLRGLGLGVGGTYGNAAGTAPASYKTVGQQTFFNWRAGTGLDGAAWRVVPQLCYYHGPFGLLAEYAISSQELRNGNERAAVQNHAWQVTTSWVLTGEDASYSSTVKPEKPADPFNGSWGAWQIVARITELNIDNDAFPRFADPSRSPARARSYGGGLNWYLNPIVRISTDYNYTVFQGATAPDEHALFSRVQFRF